MNKYFYYLIGAAALIFAVGFWIRYQSTYESGVSVSEAIQRDQPTNTIRMNAGSTSSTSSDWTVHRSDKLGLEFSLPVEWHAHKLASNDVSWGYDAPLSFTNDQSNRETRSQFGTIEITTDFLPSQSLASYVTSELRNMAISSTGTVSISGLNCPEISFAKTITGDALTDSTTTVTSQNIGVYCQADNVLYKYYLSYGGAEPQPHLESVFSQFLATIKPIPGITYIKPRSGVIKAAYTKDGRRFIDVSFVRFLTGLDAARAIQAGGCFGLNNSTSNWPCYPLDNYTVIDKGQNTSTLEVAENVLIVDMYNKPVEFNTLRSWYSPPPEYDTYWWFKTDDKGTVTDIIAQYTP